MTKLKYAMYGLFAAYVSATAFIVFHTLGG
jgi:hypothetical protein